MKHIVAGTLAMLLVSCADPYQGGYYNPQQAQYNRQMTGTLVGAAAGALIGNAVTSGGNYYGGGYCPPSVFVRPTPYGIAIQNQIRAAQRRALYLQAHPYGY